jgi:hypothetical protein
LQPQVVQNAMISWAVHQDKKLQRHNVKHVTLIVTPVE